MGRPKSTDGLTAAQRYRKRHPGRAMAATRRWEKRNPDAVARFNKASYARHREERCSSQRDWYHRNRDRLIIEQLQKRRDNPAMFLYYSAKTRAKKRGIAFSISIEDIVIPKRCPILGVRITVGKKGWHQSSPSLDRIIPSRGYTKTNIVVISHRANRIKNDATINELIQIVKFLKKITKHKNGKRTKC